MLIVSRICVFRALSHKWYISNTLSFTTGSRNTVEDRYRDCKNQKLTRSVEKLISQGCGSWDMFHWITKSTVSVMYYSVRNGLIRCLCFISAAVTNTQTEEMKGLFDFIILAYTPLFGGSQGRIITCQLYSQVQREINASILFQRAFCYPI